MSIINANDMYEIWTLKHKQNNSYMSDHIPCCNRLKPPDLKPLKKLLEPLRAAVR